MTLDPINRRPAVPVGFSTSSFPLNRGPTTVRADDSDALSSKEDELRDK